MCMNDFHEYSISLFMRVVLTFVEACWRVPIVGIRTLDPFVHIGSFTCCVHFESYFYFLCVFLVVLLLSCPTFISLSTSI